MTLPLEYVPARFYVTPRNTPATPAEIGPRDVPAILAAAHTASRARVLFCARCAALLGASVLVHRVTTPAACERCGATPPRCEPTPAVHGRPLAGVMRDPSDLL